MKNLAYQESPRQINYTNATGSDIVSGQLITLNNLVGIATVDITDGETGIVCLEGIVELPKDNSIVISQLDKVYWDTVATEVNKTASGNAYVGLAYQDEIQAATIVSVMLNTISVDTAS